MHWRFYKHASIYLESRIYRKNAKEKENTSPTKVGTSTYAL